jgi:hypothetical protein
LTKCRGSFKTATNSLPCRESARTQGEGITWESLNGLLTPELPIRGNRDPERMNLYFHDTGLLAAAMKEHARESCAGGDCGRGFASHEDAENAD